MNRQNFILPGHIMFQTAEPNFSKMTEKECTPYEAFKDFHDQTLASGGKPVEMADVICDIMDKPSVSPKAIEVKLTAEASNE